MSGTVTIYAAGRERGALRSARAEVPEDEAVQRCLSWMRSDNIASVTVISDAGINIDAQRCLGVVGPGNVSHFWLTRTGDLPGVPRRDRVFEDGKFTPGWKFLEE